MKIELKPVIVLFAICAVAAVVLAFMNNITAPVIEDYEASVQIEALEEVCCSMKIGKEHSTEGNPSVECYYPLEKNGNIEAYLLKLSGNGYGGPLTVVASFSKDGAVLAAKLASDSETPGVGKKAENPGYMDKFLGKGTSSSPIPVSKDMLSEADASSVTGASLTFTGVSKALAAGSEFVRNLGGLK